jgi:hypothetical protein
LQADIPPTAPVGPPKPQIAWNRVALVGAGVIVVLAIGAYFLFGTPKKPVANTPANSTPATTQQTAGSTELVVTKLGQLASDGTTSISSGGATNQAKLTLSFEITGSTGTDVIPEVEVQPIGTAFTGSATAKGQAATKGTDGNLQGSVVANNLADGSYHWQARATQGTKNGTWVAFGTDASAADFAIDTVAPAIPTVTTVDSQTVTAGSTVNTTSNRPTFVGKADPNTSIAISIKPEGISLNATADSSGNWSVTASSDVPNGSHDISVTSSDAAGNTSAVTLALGINTTTASSPAAAATSTSSTLAHTGDSTRLITLWAFAALILSLITLATVNRYAKD